MVESHQEWSAFGDVLGSPEDRLRVDSSASLAGIFMKITRFSGY